MKVCPKCAQSFAEGFTYCPKDATELVRYDLRARLQDGELNFLLTQESLWRRCGREFAAAARELKQQPRQFVAGLLRGEGSSRQRRHWLQAGVAAAVIAYTCFFLVTVLLGLLNLPLRQQPVAAAPRIKPDDPFSGIKLLFRVPPDNATANAAKNAAGRLGGSLTQPQRAHGGGGGSDAMPVSRGEKPLAALLPQINPPSFEPPKMQASLIVPETVFADPKTLLKLKDGPVGELRGQLVAPSRGPGEGTGIGPGKGPGYGPGKDGNTGGGAFKPGGGTTTGTGNDDHIYDATANLRPTILYKERARYTEEARQNRMQGVVVLNVVFGAEGQVREIRVLRGLPYGLTESAIEAARRIRFQPARRNGVAISVRSQLEFNFALY